MKISKWHWIGIAWLSIAIPAVAHHGTGSSYDLSKPITLQGTVTEFHYANPHPQLFFDVTDDKGAVLHWSAEFYPNPAQLIQGGWGKKRSEAALMPGTKITITLAPSRAGTQVGAILKLLNEKSEVLLGVGGGGPGEVPQGGPPPTNSPEEKKE
jgi:uncharacterized protein DUF6152